MSGYNLLGPRDDWSEKRRAAFEERARRRAERAEERERKALAEKRRRIIEKKLGAMTERQRAAYGDRLLREAERERWRPLTREERADVTRAALVKGRERRREHLLRMEQLWLANQKGPAVGEAGPVGEDAGHETEKSARRARTMITQSPAKVKAGA